MENKNYYLLFVTVSFISVCTLFLTRYPRDYVQWTKVLQKDSREFSATKSNPRKMSKLSYSFEQFELLRENKEIASARSKLSRSIANVEDGVLKMNVQLVLNAMTDVPSGENRMINKIQEARRNPKGECIIRIAKYCANRCNHLVQANHSRNWTRFECAFAKHCHIETRFVGHLSSSLMHSIDVLLIVDSLHDGLQLNRLVDMRPPGQLWVLYSRENPIHDAEYAPSGLTGNPFNLSMTYSRDTDIYFPYCTLQKKQVLKPPTLPKKTKLIAWMASNCHLLSWRRGAFVRELQKHIAVDTYGKCGDLGQLSSKEAGELLPHYKFYLSFESSECHDYITEKIWRTCFLQGIVPIVYGAKRDDYEQVVPRNSFIYIEDFNNMTSFVDYIHSLDSDEAQYNKYFNWRTEGTVNCLSARSFIMLAPEVNMCYLMRKLIHVFRYPQTSWQGRTPDFASWWKGQCLDSTVDRNVMGFNVHETKKSKG